MTVLYRKPVRLNTPQFFDYTFLDQARAVIPLSAYDTVKVQFKLEGVLYAEESAAFVSKTAGTVTKDEHTFTIPGVWQAQFCCVTPSAKKLWGEPVQFLVVPNEEDATPGPDDFLEY